ncbi:MAG: MotA/TolQ/ExbB proton channel family protein [Lachnospiraceae bacterium]|nr:MotA/TolQ/ExbB proton channel family protein [Lachnospiraceae bacterium]
MRKGIKVKACLLGLYIAVLLIGCVLSFNSKLSFESIAINFSLFLITGVIFWFAAKYFSIVSCLSDDLKNVALRIEKDAAEAEGDLWDKYSTLKGNTLFSESILQHRYDEFLKENGRFGSMTNGIYQCGIDGFINRDLLDSVMKRNLFNIVPGVMTGLGILGTFLGLSLGLREFSTGNAAEISDSIAPLMDGIKIAFHTSIYGMIFSLAFNFIYKQILEESYASLNRFVKRFDEFVLGDSEYSNAVRLRGMLMELPKAIGEQISSALKPTLEEMNNSIKDLPSKIGTQVSKTLKPEFAEVNKNLLTFSENVSENNLEGLSKIIDSFMAEMNKSMGDSFKKLGDTIDQICDMQKENGKYMQDIIKRTGATSEKIENINKISEATIDKMSSYIGNIEELQKAITASYAGVNAHMKDQDALNDKIEEYISTLNKQQKQLTDITLKMADDINSTAKELAEVSKQFNMQLTGSLDKTFECFDNNLGDIARHLSGTISEIEATTDRVPNIVLAAYDGMEKTLKELNENMKEAVASLEKMQK